MDSGRDITDQQRERITQNFKAAKIIRERKRSQITTNPPALSSPGVNHISGPRFSLDTSSSFATEFRSPASKKMNNSLTSAGELERKAMTDLNCNVVRYPPFALSPGIRSIDRDLLDCAAHQTMGESILFHKDRHPLPSDSPSANPASVDTNERSIGSSGPCFITDGLSQVFNEAALQEIDAICAQKRLREGTLQWSTPQVVVQYEQRTLTALVKEEACNAVRIETEPIFDEALLQEIDNLCEQKWLGRGTSQNLVVPMPEVVEPQMRTEDLSGDPPEFLDTKKISLPTEANRQDITHDSAPDSVVSLLLPLVDQATDLVKDCGHLDVRISGEPSLPMEGDIQPSSICAVISGNQAVPSYLQNLNASQREAANSDTTKPLLILAGPGSGKTSTMVARLLTILQKGVQPANILAMTFTTAAAMEMRERVAAAVGKSVSKELAINTFHSFCLQLCRLNADKLGRTCDFLVFGPGQQRKAVVEATRIALADQRADEIAVPEKDKKSTHISDDNPALWKEQARKWQQFVTKAKCAGKTSKDFEETGNVLGAAILRNYEKTLAACDALDYHDFITFSVALLQDHKEVLEECQKTWLCILVDEFQDTSTMQYGFLRLLASHNRLTIVGDDDQSIFGFNGANLTGFESFRRDFPGHKEVRLHQNYRSTRCIVEAASSLIQNNSKRCQTKKVFTDNVLGDKIQVRECRNEPAQCAFVVDCILMNDASSSRLPSYGNTAVLYRRQVTGRLFQATFRARKIPFNVHGVAFYRKKVIKTITALLWTALPGRKNVFAKRIFKALYGGDKAETKKVVDYIEKIARSNKCDFLQGASDIFSAKVSGTFTRRQLALGKKVLTSIRTVNHLVCKEQSLSAVITTAASLLPQRPVFDKRAVVTEDGRKLLNEDEDPRTVLEFLLDDVNDFLSNHFNPETGHNKEAATELEGSGGCSITLKSFLDHLAAREEENFRGRRAEDNNSVTLTTMHQAKGLEWDTVFIVKANETETPLLHESLGSVGESSISLEEERRLFYVAMTRARKKLYIVYVVIDSQRQVLQPSRFLKEIPHHLLEFQGKAEQIPVAGHSILTSCNQNGIQIDRATETETTIKLETMLPEAESSGAEASALPSSIGTNAFLKGFSIEARSVVAALFHTWAKKQCFQDPSRLLSKVGFVIDERLRSKGGKSRDVLISLKCCLRDEAAFSYAQHVVAWEKLPREERAVIQAERQDHFQQQNCERSLGSATATPKQVSYLRSLGCTVDPTSRLHASRLIEQYKKL